jgi:uncharacterized protein with FMN-binding domain
MRRITLWLLSTLSALVLLFSYHTSTNAKAATSISTAATDTEPSGTADTGTGTASATATPDSTGTTEGTGTSGTGSSSTTSTTTTAAATVDGDVISTRYGNVQVQITVENGTITKSIVLQVPWNNPKDQQINARAVPQLNAAAVTAQSANIDMVSGATYTSDAYIQSLQSAIDKANL